MLRVYILPVAHCSYNFDYEISRIQELNPDKIICWCSQELEYEHVFGDFLNKIQPWLESNNKIINLVTPHLDNVYVRPNVLAERTYGYLSEYMHSAFFGTNNYGSIVNQITPYPLDFGNADKLFTCYNNNYRIERGMLVDTLARENLLSLGITTFKSPERHEWTHHDGSRLFDEEDFELHRNNYIPNHFPKSFFRSVFDVIPESRYDPGEYFLTEKTLKSIMSFKPFMAFSATGYQKEYLEKYFGLKPYDELFDYGFDSVESLTGRIEGIVANIKRLSQMSLHDLIDLRRRMIPKLIYNKSQVINLFFDKEKMIPNCAKFLIDGTDYEICSQGENATISTARSFVWTKH
jgi:hypothetical protein